MSLNRQYSMVIHGIDTQPLVDHGAVIYRFEQCTDIMHTRFADGLCFGFNASLMRHLSAGNFSMVEHYQSPISKSLLAEAISLTYEAIAQIRDGNDIESAAFPNKPTQKMQVKVEDVPLHLDNNVKSALLTYRTKNNAAHQLLFFNKGNAKCIIQDASRFTIDNLDLEDGKKVLANIITRSNPTNVMITIHPVNLRLSKL